jgi:DDE domain
MAAHRFFERAIGTTKVRPAEVVTDWAPVYPLALEELLPAAWHRTDRYANNRVEADHGRLKAWLRPMRGLKQDRSAKVMLVGHAFVQNLRRGHYELALRSRSLDGCPWRSTSWPWRSDHMARSRSSVRHLGAPQQRPSEYGTCKKVEKRILPAFGNITSSWPAVAASGRRARPSTPVAPLTNSRIRDGGRGWWARGVDRALVVMAASGRPPVLAPGGSRQGTQPLLIRLVS